jgi:hypothetical protein
MFQSYLNHVEKYGEKETTIDRTNNLDGYNKENCAWKTYEEQAKNRKSNIFINYKDEKICLSDLCKKLNLNYRMVFTRIIKLDWDIEEALKIPSVVGQKHIVRTIYYNKKTLSIKEWSAETGIKPCTIRNRIARGWDIEEALGYKRRK